MRNKDKVISYFQNRAVKVCDDCLSLELILANVKPLYIKELRNKSSHANGYKFKKDEVQEMISITNELLTQC